MTAPVLEHSRSRASFDEIARHVAGGESSAALPAAGIESAFAEAGVDGHVRRVGSMLQPFFRSPPGGEKTLVAVRGAAEDLVR